MSEQRMSEQTLTPQKLARTIDHTALKPDTTEVQIRQLCEEALEYEFASVCINPTWVSLASKLLDGSPVKVCTVVGFPLGATLPSVKAYETAEAITVGAEEVDMVINIGLLKDGKLDQAKADIESVVEAAARTAEATGHDEAGVVVKVIIETFLLSEEEKRNACRIAKEAGADFVKTSTGFSGGGATVDDVELMRSVVGSDMGIKAAGGIRTAADARAMIAAGATRLGASSGVQIVRDAMGEATEDAGGTY